MVIPRSMFPRSVTARLVLSSSLLLVALGAVFLVVTVLSFRYFTRETLTATLAARDREIWTLAQEALNDPVRLSDLIERRFAPETENRFIRIRIGEKVIYQSGDPDSGSFRAAEAPWLNSDAAPRSRLEGNLLLYSRTYTQPGLGPISIATGLSYSIARAMERRLLESLAIGLPPLLLVAALVGYGLMRRALMPVETMIKAAEDYTFNEPHKRLPLVGNDPRIAALGRALNRMLDRLDGAYCHVSRFSADAAHELRTPLTLIRGDLEMIMAGQLTREEAGRVLGGALAQVDRLSATVDSLIALSQLEQTRLEGSYGRRHHIQVDLTRLADEAVALHAPAAARKGIELARVQGPPAMVTGDAGQLAQMLARLLDNAIRFTPSGGQVTVQTGQANGTVFVSVEDTGIGIDPHHHDRVFDRFYRVPLPPGEIQPGGRGPGLGLSIVRAVALAHGGRVTLRSVPGLGSIFRVDLPQAEDGGSDRPVGRSAAAALLPSVPWTGGL